MTHPITTPQRILNQPWRIVGIVLIVVFAVEVGVMLVLPHIIPDTVDKRTGAVIDATMLTTVCAPLLWWIIIAPLRRIAIAEQARSETIVANAGDGIVTMARDGKIVSFNRAAADLFLLSGEETIGRRMDQLIPGLKIEPTELNEVIQREGIRGGGARFPLAMSISRLPADDDGVFVAIIRDLTESQRAETERMHAAREKDALRAQQMATLAQLATGVAHEIRNPLTSIKMLVQANRAQLADDGLPTEDLTLVEQEIRRMERSVNALLDFARPASREPARISIQDNIARTRALIEGRGIAQKVELRTILPEAPVMLVADPGQLQQLMLNLCLNALDAMPGGGTLTIEAEESGSDVLVSVRDTGPGISPEVLQKLFTPFVTTKERGVGLGLGISRRIAEDHGGSLKGENLKNGGACFSLRLPKLPETSRESI